MKQKNKEEFNCGLIQTRNTFEASQSIKTITQEIEQKQRYKGGAKTLHIQIRQTTNDNYAYDKLFYNIISLES